MARVKIPSDWTGEENVGGWVGEGVGVGVGGGGGQYTCPRIVTTRTSL